MTKKRFLLSALPVILISLLAQPDAAQAADFTFSIPVNVTSLPPTISNGRVRCTVGRRVPGTEVSFVSAESAAFTVAAGNYSGTTTVEINVTGAHTPSEVNFWRCELWLQVRRTTGAVGWYSAYALGQSTGPIEARLIFAAATRDEIAEGTVP